MDRQALHAKLIAAFRQEAAEHVQSMSAALLAIEGNPASLRHGEVVEQLFREAHSLKGAARAVDLTDIEALCEAAEDVLAACKRGERALVPSLVDALMEVVDAVAARIPGATADAHPRRREVPAVLRQLDTALAQADGSQADGQRPDAPAPPGPAAAGAEGVGEADDADEASPQAGEASSAAVEVASTVRIDTRRLDALLVRAEALREAGGDAVRLAAALQALDARTPHTDSHIRELAMGAQRHRRAIESAADGLLEDVKRMLVLPAQSALDLLPKVVRDLAREQHKDVRLVMEGTGIAIDRRILQEIREPMLHLVRNAIDHGIEPPDARAAAGKPAQATLRVTITQQGGNRVEIAVSDDGAGIDVANLAASAQAAGLAREGNDGDPMQLAFVSGVSTAAAVTPVSGRGLGLAIVRERVERLGGVVSVRSTPGRGTEFRLALPSSLASFRAVHVLAGSQSFFLPTTHVEQVIRVAADDVRSVENRATITWRDEVLPLVRLADVLGLPPAAQQQAPHVHAVVVGAGGRRIAFEVDAVVAEQEVMAKPLGPLLARVRNVSAATLAADGSAAPILHVADLMRSASTATERAATAALPVVAPAREPKSILVAEDSITSRTLLQNILEIAGYRVVTAVDGVDAFTRLKTGTYDVLVSDVEMPRMDGFQLTARVRADPALSALPVVLVTALDSPRDRERGVDAGADAYIVKGSFDQGDLLRALERLA